MSWADQLIAVVAPIYAVKRRVAREYLNGYDAAGGGPRSVRSRSTGQNSENRVGLVRLRDNAREFRRNNPYADIACRTLAANTVGTGIRPIIKHKSKRKEALAKSLLTDYVQSIVDYHGGLDFFGIQSLAIESMIEGGESIISRRITANKNLPVPLELQILEGDYIDHMRDGALSGISSKAVMGVEFSNGKPSHYWMFNDHPGDSRSYGLSSNSSLKNADDYMHLYRVLRPGQVRGIPTGVSAFMRLMSLDNFQDARVEQQKVAALFGGVIYSESGEQKGDKLPTHLHPGILAKLNGEERIVFSNPPSVSGQGEFVTGEQHIIASAYEITYESLTGDFSKANFASGKMARIQMYANVDRLRKLMFLPKFGNKFKQWFIEAAMMRGYDIDGATIEWTLPKREILDPKNEMPAIIDEVRSGLNSLSGAMRERGINDPHAVIKELAEDIEFVRSQGLILDIDGKKTSKAGQLNQERGTEDE